MNLRGSAMPLKVEADGRIVIPADIAYGVGFKAGGNAVAIRRGKAIILFPQADLARLLDISSERMIEEMREAGGLEWDTEFLFGLTLREYAQLSQEAERRLWERAYIEESERLDAEGEPDLDLPADFGSTGQKRGDRHL